MLFDKTFVPLKVAATAGNGLVTRTFARAIPPTDTLAWCRSIHAGLDHHTTGSIGTGVVMALAPVSLPPQLPPYNLVASLRSVTAHAAAPAEASSSTYAGPSVWMMKVDGPPHWHTQSDSVCTCDAMRTMTNASGHAHCSHPLWGGDMRHRPDMIAARGKRLLPLGYCNKHNKLRRLSQCFHLHPAAHGSPCTPPASRGPGTRGGHGQWLPAQAL